MRLINADELLKIIPPEEPCSRGNSMSYKYNPYRDTFTRIDDETPITAYPVVAALTEDVIEKIADAVVRKLREEQHKSPVLERIRRGDGLPPLDTKEDSMDLIDRQSVLKAIDEYERLSAVSQTVRNAASLWEIVQRLPAAQPEPLSDACMKAVWTWLLDYQIKAAELKGRYTPYEVLSWVANDWRKEHE